MEEVRACSSQKQLERNCCQGHDNASSVPRTRPILYTVLSQITSSLTFAFLLQESGE